MSGTDEQGAKRTVGDTVFYAVLLLVFLLGSVHAFAKEDGLVVVDADGKAVYRQAVADLGWADARDLDIGPPDGLDDGYPSGSDT